MSAFPSQIVGKSKSWWEKLAWILWKICIFFPISFRETDGKSWQEKLMDFHFHVSFAIMPAFPPGKPGKSLSFSAPKLGVLSEKLVGKKGQLFPFSSQLFRSGKAGMKSWGENGKRWSFFHASFSEKLIGKSSVLRKAGSFSLSQQKADRKVYGKSDRN